MSFQFGSIKLPKLFPFLGIMTEPLAQFGTGRNILQPGIETERGFLHEMAVAGMLALLTQRLANASVKLGFYPT
jgi:hypothetical protein